jgi:hypothetical protein
MSFVLAIALFALAAGLALALGTAIRRRQKSWPDLVAGLQPMNSEAVAIVAQDFLQPQRGQIAMEPGEMWQLVGGAAGLKKMRKNAEVMLALAAWAERWNFEEGVIVSERMRREAVDLRRAVRRVELAMIPLWLLKRFRFTLPFHVQRAASAYYLMRQRLLLLYETSHAGLYPALAASL